MGKTPPVDVQSSKSSSVVGGGPSEANGKVVSLNLTFRELNISQILILSTLQPFLPGGYCRKTHLMDRGKKILDV